MAGAGTATLVSRATGAVVMMWLLRNRHNLIYVEHLFRYRLDWQMVKRILRVGVPNGLENGMFQVARCCLLADRHVRHDGHHRQRHRQQPGLL